MLSCAGEGQRACSCCAFKRGQGMSVVSMYGRHSLILPSATLSTVFHLTRSKFSDVEIAASLWYAPHLHRLQGLTPHQRVLHHPCKSSLNPCSCPWSRSTLRTHTCVHCQRPCHSHGFQRCRALDGAFADRLCTHHNEGVLRLL